MSTIIVHNESSIPDAEALEKVSIVVAGGRVSNEGKMYCYATVFHSGVVVVTARNKKSDTFIVRDDHRREE